MSNVNTPKFRVSYPKVFKAERNKLSGQDEYSVVALFPKGADLTVLKAAAQAAIEKKWGPDKSKWPTNLKSPFRDQAEKAKLDNGKKTLPAGHEEGAIFMNLKSKKKPAVVDRNVQDILVESDFYGGCWAVASVNAYAYDQAGNRGVSFGLGNIQKVGEGDSFAGRTTPEQDFAPIADEGVQAGPAAASGTSLFS